MASIFISHSSSDNAAAARLKEWLGRLGYDDIFLDFDKDDGIAPGVNWKESLFAAMKRSESVLLLVSDSWLKSAWCQGEYTSAITMGKQVVPIVVAVPSGDKERVWQSIRSRLGDTQVADLTTSWDENLPRLEHILDRSRVTPRGFRVADNTPPYRGLAAYTEAEAGLFFGREQETQELLEALRRLALRASGTRMLLVLGASGAGKSSLLRAGLWPQLRLRPAEWVPVMPMMPESSAFERTTPATHLAEAIAATFRNYDTLANTAGIQSDLHQSLVLESFSALLDRVRGAAGAPNAVVALAIDQAEKLLHAPAVDQQQFIKLLSALLATADCVAVMTMRSDTFGDAQQRRWFESIPFEVYPVGPMPLFRVPGIIRGPASRTHFQISEALVERATVDADTGDALPLLSFTFERLWRDHRGAGALTPAAYESLGAMEHGTHISPIENSVRLAAEEAVADLSAAEDVALTEAFVPGLVDLTEKLEPVRRLASWSLMPEAAHRALQKLIDAHLLTSTTNIASGSRTIEVTHEALLRRWPRLATRIESAKPELRFLQDIERAAADWSRATMQSPDTAANELRHRGAPLRRAQQLLRLDGWRRRLGPYGVAYVEACVRKNRRSVMYSAVAATVVIAVAAMIATYVLEEVSVRQSQAALQTNLQSSNYVAALASANEVLRLRPADQNTLVVKASVYFWTRDFAKAVAGFERAQAAAPANLVITKNLADSYVETGDYDRALQLYKTIGDSNPEKTQEWWYAMGRAYVFAGRYDDGLEHLKHVQTEMLDGSPYIAMAAALAGKRSATTEAAQKTTLLTEARSALRKACLRDAAHWNAVLEGDKKVSAESYEQLLPLLRQIYTQSPPCSNGCS